jgi:hypothetical protein
MIRRARVIGARVADTWDLVSRLGFPVRQAWRIAGRWQS